MLIVHPSKSSIKVQFFGEKKGDDVSVKIYKKVTKKYKKVFIESKKLEPGKTKIKEHGVNGYYVKRIRIVNGKKELKEMMYYVANEIILRNTYVNGGELASTGKRRD